MSSLITKAGKSRSQASQKARTKKGKKAAPKKSQQPVKAAAKKPSKSARVSTTKKPKKVSATKSAKKPPVSKKLAAKSGSRKLAAKPKSASTSGKSVKAKSSKSVKKPVKAASKQVKSRKPIPVQKAAARQVKSRKKAPAPSASLAVKALEQALKTFNRHDFAGAKAAFESLLEKFGDQLDIVALARTYLAVCDQRLASTRSVPRNPDALYDQGVFEFNKGNVKDAIALFDKALKAAPQADHILYSLAAAQSRLSDVPKALEALRRAIALQPINRSHARQDPDFTNLHENEAFRNLTGFGFDLTEE